MTIGRKLYCGFGSIIAIIVILFIVNRVVVFRERAASGHASIALESVQSLEAVESKTMQIQLALDDYLLTGDVRQRTKVAAESDSLVELLGKAKLKAPT